jgi:hypothetical protein
LEYSPRERSWNGTFVLPTTQHRVLLSIVAGAVEDRHRALVNELDSRYEVLAQDIASELLGVYGGPSNEPDAPVAVASADDLWDLTVLESIDVMEDGSLHLGYAFRDEVGWPDAMFSVSVRDWKVAGEFFAD